MARKVAVIGLDCADPTLVFDRWQEQLPHLRSLARAGTWGRLRSTDPPITVPAWSCMLSGRDPGELGIYGFRNRQDYSYNTLALADSRSVNVDRVWDILNPAGKRVILVGVPQTYPPLPVRGELVSCFLTPNPRQDDYTHPTALRHEVESVAGAYQVDVQHFRSDDRDRILSEVYEMTEQHFAVARHLLDTRPWDFFMMVEIGVDRIHHAFWQYMDENHAKHEPNNRYREVIFQYYRYLDEQIGELLERFDSHTTVLVVSDHGAQAMAGAVCINEWLLQEGYLALRERPQSVVPLSKAAVDWERTRAWGEGGYYSRLCLNVKAREPRGTVEPAEYEALRDELIAKLEGLPDPQGRPLGTRVYRPSDLWPVQRNIPPDLVVYFGDLRWRSNGTLGHGQLYRLDNDTGPDGANHAKHGIFLMAGPGVATGRREGLRIYDVAPTILRAFDLPVPAAMRGVPIGAGV